MVRINPGMQQTLILYGVATSPIALMKTPPPISKNPKIRENIASIVNPTIFQLIVLSDDGFFIEL